MRGQSVFNPKQQPAQEIWQGFSAFQGKDISRSLEQYRLPTPVGHRSTFRIQQIGENEEPDRAASMMRFARVLWSHPDLGEIGIELPGIQFAQGSSLPAIKPPPRGSQTPQTIADELFTRLCDNTADPLWLAVDDDQNLPTITNYLLKAFASNPDAVPTSVLIGSGRATVVLNALAHTVGLVTFIGCEPRGGDAMTGTFMSTESSRANLAWRCGPDYREQQIALVRSDNQIRVWPEAPCRIEGRLYGGDIVRFDEFLSLYGTAGLRVPYILALESTGVQEGELKRTIARWGRERLEVLNKAQAILIGKVNYQIGSEDEQAHIAQLLVETIGDGAPPIVRTNIFGHKTVPYFLPIGGLIGLTIDTTGASMTVPVSVKPPLPRE
jgi:hypothetical protein